MSEKRNPLIQRAREALSGSADSENETDSAETEVPDGDTSEPGVPPIDPLAAGQPSTTGSPIGTVPTPQGTHTPSSPSSGSASDFSQAVSRATAQIQEILVVAEQAAQALRADAETDATILRAQAEADASRAIETRRSEFELSVQPVRDELQRLRAQAEAVLRSIDGAIGVSAQPVGNSSFARPDPTSTQASTHPPAPASESMPVADPPIEAEDSPAPPSPAASESGPSITDVPQISDNAPGGPLEPDSASEPAPLASESARSAGAFAPRGSARSVLPTAYPGAEEVSQAAQAPENIDPHHQSMDDLAAGSRSPESSLGLEEQAVLKATQMAVAGESRSEIDRSLREELGFTDTGWLLDDILGPG